MRNLLAIILVVSVVSLALAGFGYSTFQRTDEQNKASWAEVLNQYPRRSDLAPNLVSTVDGGPKFEQDTLVKVVGVRSTETAVQASPELISGPSAFEKSHQAQKQFTGALSRLLVASENYPNSRR
jgi:LemA protein